MTRKLKLRVYTMATVLVFAAIAEVASGLIGVPGLGRLALRGTVWLMGLAAAFLVYLFFSKSTPADEPVDESAKELDRTVANARSRLADSTVEGGKIGKLPLVLFLGPAGAAKTSIIEQSGLDAELLAGDVYRRDALIPTECVNAWFADGTLLVEAGGPLLEEQGKWLRLARHLRPDRLAPTLGRGQQAPRVAVVCYPCTELMEPGFSDSVPAAARLLRERLSELASSHGIRLPVYVVFTKADRIPFFEDFVRSLDREEAREVLGVTLPLDDQLEGATYADRQSGRLLNRYDDLFSSMARHRLEFLSRESEDQVRAGVYEFPREFHKLRDSAVSFLVELCRPSQLSISPFLRGFYFTGVRPVVVSDSAGGAAPAIESVSESSSPGATRIFDARQAQSTPRAPAAPAGKRKVPEWVFVRRLFPHLFLGDEVAQVVTGGGNRINFLRRLLLGAATVAAVVVSIGLSVSFARNRALVADVGTAYEQTERLQTSAASRPSLADLDQLNELRGVVELLRRYEQDGPPLSYRWGLYKGSELLPNAREVYFRRAGPLVMQPAMDRLYAKLDGLPPVPDASSDYSTIHDELKAYLITRDQCQGDAEFLLEVLEAHWLERYGLTGSDSDADLRGVARQQLAFYAVELSHGNPYDLLADGTFVRHVRAYLDTLSGEDAFYNNLTLKAAKTSQAVNLDGLDPGAGAVLKNDYEVPGAFTRAGWNAVEGILESEQLLAGEECVTGGGGPSDVDLGTLRITLRDRYVREYAEHWSRFLSSADVTGFGSLRQAEGSLDRLSKNTSPLLALLRSVSWHTDVDSAAVGFAFQPVRVVILPDTAAPLVGATNEAYVNDLISLHLSVGQVASSSNDPLAVNEATRVADQVESTVRQIGQGFDTQGSAATVGNEVERLLKAPARLASGLLAAAATGPINMAGRQFCVEFSRLADRYPFDRQAGARAEWDDVDAMFKTDGGILWGFYDDYLSEMLTREGRHRPGADPRATEDFAAFFEAAAAFSNALYREGMDEPRVSFSLRLETSEELPRVTLYVDGAPLRFTQARSAEQLSSWRALRASEAKLLGDVTGQEQTLYEFTGTWALHQLLEQADWEDGGGGGTYILRWPVHDGQVRVTGHLRLTGGSSARSFLDVRSLGNLQCVPRVAR